MRSKKKKKKEQGGGARATAFGEIQLAMVEPDVDLALEPLPQEVRDRLCLRLEGGREGEGGRGREGEGGMRG
eukprot:2695210-Rhodomonas_salina.1